MAKKQSNQEKIVRVDMENPEGRMKLKVKGKNAVNNSLKIMEAFDSACEEIRKEEQK